MNRARDGNQVGFGLRGLLLIRFLTLAIALCSEELMAMPRAPMPPFPEPTAVCQQGFDEAFFFGETNAALVLPGFGFVDESWSGYALNRTGQSVVAFTIPGVGSTGHVNVASDSAYALRWWFSPAWSSQSEANGAGPGTNAVLIEYDASSGSGTAVVWSLQVTPDGNELVLWAATNSGFVPVIQTPISWQVGEWHCIALDFGTNSVLYLDGRVVAEGPGFPSIPPSLGELTLGSMISGENPAQGDVEEWYSFDHWLTDRDLANYYCMVSLEAALGPASDDQGGANRSGGVREDDIHSVGSVYDPTYDATGCITNGPPFLTNITITPQADSNITVTFTVQGGTNGVFYDVYSSSQLASTFPATGWVWLGQVLNCSTYSFSNQPSSAAFISSLQPR